MCYSTITRCVDCRKLIDSVLKPCKKHTSIKIDDKEIGYCPVNKSLDGYAINPETGKPFNPKQRLPLEGEYYRHRVKHMTSLCFWCRGSMSRECFENRRSDYYNRCSDVADVVFDGRGNCQLKEPEIRHELWDLGDDGVHDYKAYWRPKDDAKVGLAPVANGVAREATHKPPVHLLTRQEDFLWFEPAEVVRPDFPVEELWVRSQGECPLHNLMASSGRPLKRNRATVEAATTLEAQVKKAKFDQAAQEAVKTAREYASELEEFDSFLDIPLPGPPPLELQPANTPGSPPQNTLESPPIVEATMAAALPQGQYYDHAPAHPADIPLNILFNDVLKSPHVDEATIAPVLVQHQYYDPAPTALLDDDYLVLPPEPDFDSFLELNPYPDTTTANAPLQDQPHNKDSGFYDQRLKTPDLEDFDNDMFPDIGL